MQFYKDSELGLRTGLRGLGRRFLAPEVTPRSPLLIYTIPPPNSTFPQLCTPSHTKTPTQEVPTPRAHSPRRAPFFPTGNFVVLALPSSFRLVLEDHVFHHLLPLYPPARGWRPLCKPARPTWPKSRKWLKMKTLQDGPERERIRHGPMPGTGGSSEGTPALAPQEVPPPVRSVLYARPAPSTGELGVRLRPQHGVPGRGRGFGLLEPSSPARAAHAFWSRRRRTPAARPEVVPGGEIPRGTPSELP